MDWNQIWILMKPTILVIAEQLPGLVISLVTSFCVANVYFKRQREIDKAIEKQEVMLYHKKLLHAYITALGKRPKVGTFHMHEAMEDLRAKLEIYQPEYDTHKWLEDSLEEAKKFIVDHQEDFEDIPKGS
jgi:hypothetical protein